MLIYPLLIELQLIELQLTQPHLTEIQPISVHSIIARTMQMTPRAALERFFTAPAIQSEWFAESFSSQVPIVQLEQIRAEIQRSLGNYQSTPANPEPDGSYLVQFAKGKVSAQIILNESGQITGLLLKPVATAIAPNQAIQQLRALPGKTNLLILEDGGELAAYNADEALAVGSAFKLAVLAALRSQIDRGEAQRNWRDVVALRPQDKSLPSGILQTWFEGSLLTVQTLATLMISQSDNTATDTLIHLLGREAIEAISPGSRNQPFPTTREFFALKNPENEALLQRYRTANRQQRQQILQELANAPLPDASLFAGKPIALDVEWFYTPRELCRLMQKVEDLPLMAVNPGGGLVEPSQWQRVAFKGGSEPGVLNLTTSLKAANGKTYCVSATWNDVANPVSETQFYTLYSGVIEGLRARVSP